MVQGELLFETARIPGKVKAKRTWSKGEASIHSPGQRDVDRAYSSSVVLHKMKGFYWILILLLLSVGQIESVQAAPASPRRFFRSLWRIIMTSKLPASGEHKRILG